MRGEARVESGERSRRGWRDRLCTAGEDRDRAPVDRAGGERATDRELHSRGAVVAAEQHDVDHLPSSVRASVATDQSRPQLVETVRPLAAAAFLVKRERVLEPAGLACEQLEVVVELGAGAELAVDPFMAGDLLAAVVDRDLACTDPRADLQPGERDRH